MKIIKRSGTENEFDAAKIIAAVRRQIQKCPRMEKVSDEQIEK